MPDLPFSASGSLCPRTRRYIHLYSVHYSVLTSSPEQPNTIIQSQTVVSSVVSIIAVELPALVLHVFGPNSMPNPVWHTIRMQHTETAYRDRPETTEQTKRNINWCGLPSESSGYMVIPRPQASPGMNRSPEYPAPPARSALARRLPSTLESSAGPHFLVTVFEPWLTLS